MPPNSLMIVTHAVRHLNDDERPLIGLDRAPLDRSLSSGIVGETVTDVSSRCRLSMADFMASSAWTWSSCLRGDCH